MAKSRRKVTVLLDEHEYAQFERYCDARGFKKSTLVARLIRDHLKSENFASQSEFEFRLRNQNRRG
jgi:hypothetical protein